MTKFHSAPLHEISDVTSCALYAILKSPFYIFYIILAIYFFWRVDITQFIDKYLINLTLKL
ncbi:MAG TPA: hypothetical protein DCS28_03125 [Candidatus Moranbacteria bacterium]|nr:hypothetical protein [Candidatus Moranbacteria bacterium]HAT75004.1 hypothetical protein [Candidatus Moranbacteria bacterium]